MVQLDEKIGGKGCLLPLCDVVFRSLQDKSIAFSMSKHSFYTGIVMLLAAQRAAFRRLFSMLRAVFDKHEPCKNE